MKRITLRSMVVIICAVAMSLLGSSARAVCPSPPTGPICSARTGFFCSNVDTTPCTVDADCPGGICSALIFGTAAPNGANVTSITTDSGHLVISTTGLGTPAAAYRVHWDGFGSPFSGNVTAANANGSCTVPVRFSSRLNVAPNNEVLCSDGTLTFKVITAKLWAAGQNACASTVYTCADGLPPTDSQSPHPLLDFPIPTTLFTIATPIHANPGQRDVIMDLTKAGAYDAHLRLAFARSTDNGANYSAFTDATTQVVAGSTRIIGTGEWSSVRAAVAVSPNNYPVSAYPAMSEWGRLLLAFFVFATLGWLSWRYGTARRVSRHP